MDQIYEVKSTFLRLMKWVPGVFYEPAGLDGECLDTVLVDALRRGLSGRAHR